MSLLSRSSGIYGRAVWFCCLRAMLILIRQRSPDHNGPTCVGAVIFLCSRGQVYESCWSCMATRFLRGIVASILRVPDRLRGGACIFSSRRGESWDETDRGTHSGAIIKWLLPG